MNLREYVSSGRFNLEERKEAFKRDPHKIVIENDSLPYDDIIVLDGKLQKVVFAEDSRPISVVEILSYTKLDDIPENDTSLRELYSAYMSNVDVEAPTFQQLRELLEKAKLNVHDN